MKTKIFCDSADYTTIKKHNNNSLVSGFTTNPSLMKLAWILGFGLYSLKHVHGAGLRAEQDPVTPNTLEVRSDRNSPKLVDFDRKIGKIPSEKIFFKIYLSVRCADNEVRNVIIYPQGVCKKSLGKILCRRKIVSAVCESRKNGLSETCPNHVSQGDLAAHTKSYYMKYQSATLTGAQNN